MVTWTTRRTMNADTSGRPVYYCEGDCLSTDPKPTAGIFNGSILVEIDTGSIYKFNADAGTWALTWG